MELIMLGEIADCNTTQSRRLEEIRGGKTFEMQVLCIATCFDSVLNRRQFFLSVLM